MVDDFQFNVLKAIADKSFHHGPYCEEPTYAMFYPDWSETVREATPEYLPVLLNVLVGNPSLDYIGVEFGCDDEDFIGKVGLFLNAWSEQDSEFVLRNTVAFLRDNLGSPGRSTFLTAMRNVDHPHLTKYVDESIIDYPDYTEGDRISLAMSIGDSRGIGSAKLLNRLLDNTPKPMEEARMEIVTKIWWVGEHGERAELD